MLSSTSGSEPRDAHPPTDGPRVLRVTAWFLWPTPDELLQAALACHDGGRRLRQGAPACYGTNPAKGCQCWLGSGTTMMPGPERSEPCGRIRGAAYPSRPSTRSNGGSPPRATAVARRPARSTLGPVAVADAGLVAGRRVRDRPRVEPASRCFPIRSAQADQLVEPVGDVRRRRLTQGLGRIVMLGLRPAVLWSDTSAGLRCGRGAGGEDGRSHRAICPGAPRPTCHLRRLLPRSSASGRRPVLVCWSSLGR